MINKARCHQQYCSNEATMHIKKGYAGLMWGYCAHHHNVAYFYAGRPVYRELEICSECQSEKVGA